MAKRTYQEITAGNNYIAKEAHKTLSCSTLLHVLPKLNKLVNSTTHNLQPSKTRKVLAKIGIHRPGLCLPI